MQLILFLKLLSVAPVAKRQTQPGGNGKWAKGTPHNRKDKWRNLALHVVRPSLCGFVGFNCLELAKMYA
jgi:hypothetical protein